MISFLVSFAERCVWGGLIDRPVTCQTDKIPQIWHRHKSLFTRCSPSQRTVMWRTHISIMSWLLSAPENNLIDIWSSSVWRRRLHVAFNWFTRVRAETQILKMSWGHVSQWGIYWKWIKEGCWEGWWIGLQRQIQRWNKRFLLFVITAAPLSKTNYQFFFFFFFFSLSLDFDHVCHCHADWLHCNVHHPLHYRVFTVLDMKGIFLGWDESCMWAQQEQ